MPFKLLVTPIAQENIEEAYNYYFENAGPGVAEWFFEDLQSAYDALEINPFYQIRIKNFRALPLKKFPYLVFFEIIEERKVVRISALFHTSQDSEKWPD